MSAGRKHESEVREAIEALYADGYPRLLIFAKLNENDSGPKLRFISKIIADCPKPEIHRCHRCGEIAPASRDHHGICLCEGCAQAALVRRREMRNAKRRKSPPAPPFTHPPCIVCGCAIARRDGEPPYNWKRRRLCGSAACLAAVNSRSAAKGHKIRRQRTLPKAGARRTINRPLAAPADRADEASAIAAFIAARGREAIRVKPAFCAPTAQGCLEGELAKRRLKRLKLESIPTWRQQRQAQAKAAGLEPCDGE